MTFPAGKTSPPSQQPRWLRRIGWFIALWIIGVAAVGVLAYAIRLMIP
ncbi:DUF2474 domain-containing protein [Thioclava sp. SK-1]|nr:DUF2474 domain-containing protein [Thioclava sp. SK-1]